MPLGAVRAAAQGTGYKYRRLGKSHGVRFDSRLHGLICTVRCALSLKLPLSLPCSHFECLWKHSGRLSSTCILVGAVNFTVTPAENFVSPLSESSPSPRKHQKKKVSVAARQSVHPSERSPALPSSFFVLQTRRSTYCK